MSFRNSNTKAGSGLESSAVSGTRSATSSTRTRVAVSRLLEDGEHFGKYEIVRWIARGGMSEVYEAIHTGLRKPVALKVLRGELAENGEARERFALEGSNAALVRHPNVVDVSDVGFVDELPFLVMELLEGESLGDVLGRIERMPVSDAVDLLLPVTAAVCTAHEHGVIHRDLKPDNIFLQYEGPRIVPKVLDFGASRVMHRGRLTMNSSVLGTPHYMSPEQARGETGTDARSDQHALGVILYEAVVGCLPRDSSDPLELLHQVAYGPFRPPSEHMPLPDGLEEVIVRAIARESSQRFPTTRDFGLALLPFASEASRDYWSLELRYPSARRSVDIAQPAVSSRRFTPGSAAPPTAPEASDRAAGVPITYPEVGNRMLPSSRPPPPLLRPDVPAPDADDPILEAKRSSKRKLFLIGGVIAVAAVVALLSSSGRNNTARDPSAVAAKTASLSNPVAIHAPPPETTGASATTASALPEPSATNRALSVVRRAHVVVPAKKAEPSAPKPAAVGVVAIQEPSPKVRVIEDSKPKVKVIE